MNPTLMVVLIFVAITAVVVLPGWLAGKAGRAVDQRIYRKTDQRGRTLLAAQLTCVVPATPAAVSEVLWTDVCDRDVLPRPPLAFETRRVRRDAGAVTWEHGHRLVTTWTAVARLASAEGGTRVEFTFPSGSEGSDNGVMVHVSAMDALLHDVRSVLTGLGATSWGGELSSR